MKLLIASSAIALGFVVGVPFYGIPFFYDYFARPTALGGFGWSRSAITLGLPLGTLVTLFAGPLLVSRLPPRASLILGTILASLALIGMGRMPGNLAAYYAFWLLYMTGWTFAGPIVHQTVLTQRVRNSRGSALAFSSLGISILGALAVRLFIAPITQAHGFRNALSAVGASVLLALPFIFLMLRDTPQPHSAAPSRSPAIPLPALLRDRSFWLLLTGSTCTIAALGAINQHLKLIFHEIGFFPQSTLDRVYGETMLIMLLVGAVGRLSFGWLADRFPKRHVLSAAFLLMAVAAPLLLRIQPPATPYLFATLFGLGMGVDFLLTPLLAADHFGAHSMPRVMAIILPVNSIGQSWFPYAISHVREHAGSYTIPIAIVFACALAGRLIMALLPNR